MNAQIYCTVAELVTDIKPLSGTTESMFRAIQAASKFIERRFGNFIPIIGSKMFGAAPFRDLNTPPVLSISSVTNNGITVTDYTLFPRNRFWEHGPYSRLYRDGSWDDEDVVITGKWGLYDDSILLGISATQLIGATTLSVTNGAMVSPGMVLLVEDEQELVTGVAAPSAAVSLLDGAVGFSDEVVTVDNGSELNPGEVIQISTEDMLIRHISGNDAVVSRGWNGTIQADHADDSPIKVYRSYTITRGVNGTTAAAHTSAAVSRCLVPDDVNWLCRQIAGLMVKKAESGFAGKTGNAETGETFYFNEFPSQIKEIKKNYRIVSL
jgi:hypothetical protein